MSRVRVAAVQSALSDDPTTNIELMIELVREAARGGAHIVLMPELFEGHYFPQHEREQDFARAHEASEHPTIAAFSAIAKELGVVIPVSFFERAGQEFYNSIAIVDASGDTLGTYRKSHIPDGPGYEEKFYFRQGDTGFRAWSTRHGRIGVGICWDQWFPEAARAMVLAGADILLYPTAIGSEPQAPDDDTRDPWRRVMIGHAVANTCPVVAANRIGVEGDITFYGSSFIADHRGDIVASLNRSQQSVILSEFDLDMIRRYRANFGLFRDRRPDLYGSITELSPPAKGNS